MRVIILLLFASLVLAEVKAPQGVESKGSGLSAGFLETFPEYNLKTENLTSKETKYFGAVSPNEIKVFSFSSKLPAKRDKDGKTYLRFKLTQFTFSDEATSKSALANFLSTAKESTGHSYAWDLAVKNKNEIFLLSAPCLFSEQSFSHMSGKLRQALDKSALESVMCRCGAGCRLI